MPAPSTTFQLTDGAHAAGHAAELQALRAEVDAELPHGHNPAAVQVAGRFEVQLRQPGFVVAAARSGGYLLGYATGMPLRAATSWWRNVTAPLPDELTAEHAGRTFALIDLVVRASWRRQGIGRSLHDLILASRAEERAAAVVAPTAAAAQTAFQNWGWRKVARTRSPVPGETASDLLVIALPLTSR